MKDTDLPLITIIIPAYNYAHLLHRAVESVMAQIDDANAEVLIIDDGSTDETPATIESLSRKFPQGFRALRKENGGLASVRNRGILEANGQYLIFLDADDEMVTNALKAIQQHILNNPESQMIICGHISIEENGSSRNHLPSKLSNDPVTRLSDYLLSKKTKLVNGACVMHRKVFERGNYPELFRNSEDIPVFSQVLANYSCSILKQPVAKIYKHNDSLRHNINHAKAGELKLVEEVFSPQRLDKKFFKLKNAYKVQRCLSLFRTAYLVEDIDTAKYYFKKALKHDPRVLFKFSYVSKALRMWKKSLVKRITKSPKQL
ncbi:MAG: glycosyltransferase family 2 protein [Desulfobacterales bacterium]|nr:glycosyltransferase family 2 protein [Desulfobacterales bacterium]